MEVVYVCCCGIDVHKKLIVACSNKGQTGVTGVWHICQRNQSDGELVHKLRV